MTLLIPTVVSGIVVGLLYGLLAFSIVFLFKATGVANFAQGNIATFTAFMVYLFAVHAHLGLWLSIGIGAVGAAAFGVLLYFLALRVNDDAGAVNLTIRTLAVYVLIFAVINEYWGAGQPFSFPSVFPQGSLLLGSIRISIASLGTLLVAVALAALFGFFFSRTSLGLVFLGMAERPDIARLLGVNTRRMSAIAWGIAALVSLVVGLLTAPSALLSSDMMDLFLLYAFTGAVIGGLTSLVGAFVGGAIVGILGNTTAVYAGPDVEIFVLFLLLILVLLVKPDGIFGTSVQERL